jgi:CHAD domain-containing protein
LNGVILTRTKKRAAPELTNEQLAAGGTFLVALAAAALTVKLIRNRSQRTASTSLGLRTNKGLGLEVRRVARLEIDNAITALKTSGDPISSEGVHEARKSIKRLRSLLRLTRHELGNKAFQAENQALRQIARRLSDSRDSDVMVATLDSLTATYATEIPAGVFDDLRAALETKAETERTRLAAHTSAVNGAISELHALRARVAGWPLPENGTVADLKPGVRYVYKRGRDANDAAHASPSTNRLHDLRRRTKDVVHTAQLLDAASPKAGKIASRGKAVNEMLGEDHDLAMLRSGATTHAETLAPGHLELLKALIDRRRDAIQREATDQAGLLYNRPPKQMTVRFIAKS